MKATWALQDAKNRFSEVVEHALKDGPQVVTRRGQEAVVIVAAQQYRALSKPKEDLATFFARSPLRGLSLVLRRDQDPGRDVAL